MHQRIRGKPLDPAILRRLRAALERAGSKATTEALQLDARTLLAATAGDPVHRGTHAAIALHLPKLEAIDDGAEG